MPKNAAHIFRRAVERIVLLMRHDIRVYAGLLINGIDVPVHCDLKRPFETRITQGVFMLADTKPVMLFKTDGGVKVSGSVIRPSKTTMFQPDYKQGHIDFLGSIGTAIFRNKEVYYIPDVAPHSVAMGKDSLHMIRHPKIGWTGKASEYGPPIKIMRKLIHTGPHAFGKYCMFAFVSGYKHAFEPEQLISSICGFFPPEEYEEYIKLDGAKVARTMTPGAQPWNDLLEFAATLKYDRNSFSNIVDRSPQQSAYARMKNKVTALTTVEKSMGNNRIMITQSAHLEGVQKNGIGAQFQGLVNPPTYLYAF